MPAPKKYTKEELDQREKNRKLRRAREVSENSRDISEAMYSCMNPERREECRLDLKTFLETYMAEAFYLDWSPDHLKALAKIQTSVLDKGLFALAMPRGSGKSTMCLGALMWVILYAHKRYPVLIGATSPASEKMLMGVVTFMTTNQLLLEDFPEACIPFQALGGQANRAGGQLCNGLTTKIKLGKDKIILPYIEDDNGDPYPTSSLIVETGGLTSAIRGKQHITPDGEILRPDFVIIDDPQTTESANSVTQIAKREELINKDVLGLAGADNRIDGVCPCTIIAPDDLAAKLLDRKISPRWRGEIYQMMRKMPVNLDAWEAYRDLYFDALRADEYDAKKVNDYYLENRETLDEGGEASWDKRKTEHEVSAIQHAMHLYLEDEESFFSEYQNAPKEKDIGRRLKPKEVQKKINGYKKLVIPQQCNDLTAFIDVQDDLLWYTVIAWEKDATGYVIDYGAFPDQKMNYYTNVSAKYRLKTTYPHTTDLGGRLFAGLTDLCDRMLEERERDDGVLMTVNKVLIDAGWGLSTKKIYQFCREYGRAEVLPYMGFGIKASSKPMSEYSCNSGEMNFNHARLSVPKDQKIRRIDCDVNYWKTVVAERLGLANGSKGGLTLFKERPERHKMFAEQMTSEMSILVKSPTREVDEWKHPNRSRDNHLFDCVVGASAAADMIGIKPDNDKPKMMTKGERLRRNRRSKVKYL
jgi:hypothetical protein